MAPRLLTTLVLLAACAAGNAPLSPGGRAGYHVLFIGISLTSSNDLPGTVAQLSALVNDTIEVESVTRPNFAISDHVNGMSDAVAVVRRGGGTTWCCRRDPPASRCIVTR